MTRGWISVSLTIVWPLNGNRYFKSDHHFDIVIFLPILTLKHKFEIAAGNNKDRLEHHSDILMAGEIFTMKSLVSR